MDTQTRPVEGNVVIHPSWAVHIPHEKTIDLGMDAVSCLEFRSEWRTNDISKKMLAQKLRTCKWNVSLETATHGYLYVIMGKMTQHDAAKNESLEGTPKIVAGINCIDVSVPLAGWGESGAIGEGGVSAVALAAGATTTAATVISAGVFIVVPIIALSIWYARKRMSSNNCYFLRIARGPYVNPGEKIRSIREIRNDGQDWEVKKLGRGSYADYSDWLEEHWEAEGLMVRG